VLGRRRRRGSSGYAEGEVLGRGTFATVHVGVEEATGRTVALKVLDLTPGPEDLELFRREASALGAVSSHPNIVTLHGAEVRPDGRPVLVMERCVGSFADRLASGGPVPTREPVAVGVQLAGALESAHRAGVLHRDLKPANVLLTGYGVPVLADFGIAGLHDVGSSRAHRSGLTAHHAAPEVLLGGQASPASDVYGLASLLHELLTGHPPFFVTTHEPAAEVQRRIIADPPPRLAAPGVPAALRELLRRAMSKEPTRRPTSALEVAQHLRAIERNAGWPPTACRVTGLDELPPLPRSAGGPRPVRTEGATPVVGGRGFDGPPPARDLVPPEADAARTLPGRDAPLLPSAPTGVVRHDPAPPDLPPPTGSPAGSHDGYHQPGADRDPDADEHPGDASRRR
jgi:serine/threonine protein kinase